jgi:hypothetical protein
MGSSGTSTSTAMVKLPDSCPSGRATISGTAVRIRRAGVPWPARASATAAPVAESSTSVIRTPYARAMARTSARSSTPVA